MPVNKGVPGELIRALRKQANLTQAQLAEKVGVSKTSIASWENDYYSPEGENLYNLADTLNVSVDYLLGRTDDSRGLINKAGLEEATDSQVPPDINVFTKTRGGHPRFVRIPVYGREFEACCGGGFVNPEYMDAQVEEYIDLSAEFVGYISPDKDKQPFVITAEGDSMANAGILDGAQVVVNPGEPVYDGDAAMVLFSLTPDTCAQGIKRVYFLDGGGIEIRSDCGDNWKRTFMPSESDEKTINIIGKVEGVWTKVRRK